LREKREKGRDGVPSMKGVGDKHSSTERYKNVEQIIKSQKKEEKIKMGGFFISLFTETVKRIKI